MGTLSALGRSGALARNTQNLMNTAISLRGMKNQEEQNAQTNAINLRRLEIAEGADARAGEAAKREATAFGWKEKEQKELDAKNAIVTPWELVTKNMTPGVKEWADKTAKENGWIEEAGGTEVISNLNKKNAFAMLNERLEMSQTMSKLYNQDLKNMRIALDKEKAEMTVDGAIPAPKVVEDWQARSDALDAKMTSAVNASVALDAEAKKQSDAAAAVVKAQKESAALLAKTRKEEIRLRSDLGVGEDGSTDTKTAMIKNIEYLVRSGWSQKDAEGLMTGSKPMSRDTYVARTTMQVMNNVYIPDEDKESTIQKALDIYDQQISSGKSTPPEGYELTEGLFEGKKLFYNPYAEEGKQFWQP